jgi:hypothetical protein
MTDTRFVSCPFCGAHVCGRHVGCAPIYSAVVRHIESEHSLHGADAAHVAHVLASRAIGVSSDAEMNTIIESLAT